jgi:pimeloyl-ACP methyl ester carboxylesterase
LIDRSASPDGFVLVHGGFHASWCWGRLIPLLQRPALAVDLPGRSGKSTDFTDIGLDDWVKSIVDQAAAFEPRRLALVAHSLGGISMPAAAAQMPGRIAALVFVSAVIPREGETARDAMPGVGDENFSAAGEFLAPPPEGLRIALCKDMNEEDTQWVLSRVSRAEPGGPVTTPVTRSGMPPVRTIYVRPTEDNGVPWAAQEQMIANLGAPEEFVVEAGHNVILSRPDLIADILNAL